MADAVKKKKACYYWPLSKCDKGEDCPLDHHPNLDPWHFEEAAHDYRVPNEVGKACTSCYQTTRQCDKLDRGGVDDPCSECRWFGGPGRKCTLDTKTTYNDQLFKWMLERRDFNYNLAANKARDVPRGKRKNIPTAMPDDEVKEGWTGESTEALLQKPDMLPPFVRQLPRAYLVPPNTRPKPFVEEDEVEWAHPPPPAPTFAMPPTCPNRGDVISAKWMVQTRRWVYTYGDGSRFTFTPC